MVEVLSPSTAAYDRGRKFELYRQVETLSHYCLSNKTAARARNCFARIPKSCGVLQPLAAADTLRIPEQGIEWPIATLHADVDFERRRRSGAPGLSPHWGAEKNERKTNRLATLPGFPLDRHMPWPASHAKHPTAHQHHRAPAVARAGGRFFRWLRISDPVRTDARLFAISRSDGPWPRARVAAAPENATCICAAFEAVGNYAVQPHFSDGHNTGIFSWDYLYHLGSKQDELWQKYEARLAAAGDSRDAPMTVQGGGGSACGHEH